MQKSGQWTRSNTYYFNSNYLMSMAEWKDGILSIYYVSHTDEEVDCNTTQRMMKHAMDEYLNVSKSICVVCKGNSNRRGKNTHVVNYTTKVISKPSEEDMGALRAIMDDYIALVDDEWEYSEGISLEEWEQKEGDF